MRRFGGIYPVLYAFYDRYGRIDPGAMRAQVEHCIEAGAHGITVLGLVTEVKKLSTAERQDVVEMAGRAIGGRVGYAVTVAEQDAERQIAFVRIAAATGADWAILQPPPGRGHDDASLSRHFGAIADAAELPVAIQNNPVNLESALSPAGLVALVRAHPNIRLLKAEGSSLDIASVLQALEGAVDAFGGHGGLEFLSLLRSGGAGLIPAPDCVALQVAIYDALRSGEPAAVALAGRLHKEILPLIVFMTQGIPVMWCYGKRLMARRLGIADVFDRDPCPAPSSFGLAESERLFADVQRAEAELLPELHRVLRPHAAA
jgi:4-hydroxy-tetrahydrodipicolinate synthase